jgi:HSP20 family protein
MLSTMFPMTFRNPVFDRLSEEMDRLFEATTSMLQPLAQESATAWPGLNIWRQGDSIVAEAEVPGFRMDDVEVLAGESGLTIRGERPDQTPKGATPLRVERGVHRFERTVSLPVEIDAERVEATLNNGVLRVTLPIAESALPRRIEVKALPSGS